MPIALDVKSTDLDTVAKRSKYSICVIGCGQKGIFYSNALADAGFKVICTDADASVVKKVGKGKTSFSEPEVEARLKTHISNERIDVVSELKKAVSQSDVVVIAITAKVDEKKKIETSALVNTCKQVGSALHEGMLVIYGGIAGFGFTEGTIKETLENTSGLKCGSDFGLAYNPILTVHKTTENCRLKVAAADKCSLDAAANILKTITKNVKQINDIKTAEIATLATVARNDVNRALANELAMFCENANIDYFEALKLLDLDESSFSPSTFGEGNKNAAYLLLDSAESLNAKLKLPALARQINEDMVKHAVNLTQEGLRQCDKTLRRARVTLLGPAHQTSATGLFVSSLEQKGAKVVVYDPLARNDSLDAGLVKTSLNEAVEGSDCIVLISEQEPFSNFSLKKIKALMKSPSVVVDLAGKFDHEAVETEGFKYCGLGRTTG